MSAGELRVGQVLPLEFTIYDQDELVLNVTGGTFVLKITDPNGAPTERPATPVSDGSDGKVTLTTDEDDFARVGTHKLQLVVTLSGVEYPSDILEVQIFPNLPDEP